MVIAQILLEYGIVLMYNCFSVDLVDLLNILLFQNCGLQQGLLLSRQPIPNPASPDSNHHFSDLNLGQTVDFYGRKITIADCDQATKVSMYIRW